MPRFQIVLVLVSFAAGILWFQPPTTDKNQPKESASDAHLKSLVDSSEEPSRNTGAPEATFAKSPFEKVEDGEPTLISVSKTPVSEQLPIDPTQDRPDVVLQALVDLPLTGSSEAELLNRLKSWSEDSADDAALWIETTLSGAEPESAAYALRHSFLNLWLKIEPEVALQRLELFADEDELPYLIADHVVRLADEHNSQYALNWAESSTEGAVRSRAVKDALDHWLTHDADGLAAELLVRIDEGKKTQQNTPQVDEILSNMGDRLVDKLAEQDPVKALNWAERLPSDQVETAQERVAGEWLKQDAVSAHQWLDSVLADTGTLPTGVASAIPFADIDLALATWNVVEDSAREAMTEGIVETLSVTDPIAARAWVDQLKDPLLNKSATRIWIGVNVSQLPNEALAAALASPQDASRPALIVDTAVAVAAVDPQLLQDWLASAPLNELDRTSINSLGLFDQ